MIKLLLVEDDANLCYIIQSGLEDLIGGYEVITARNGREGLNAFQEGHPDIIVSDVDMPDMNGFEMVSRIRETDTDIPILFASGLQSPKDVKNGFKIGVNNYIKKPFSADELDAYIHAMLKMRQGSQGRNDSSVCHFGPYTLDASHATLRHETGKQTILTQREAELLMLLAQNKNEVVRREVILSRLWNVEDDYFASRSLDVFVTKLRKLFSDEPTIEVKTVRGVGIMLEVLSR